MLNRTVLPLDLQEVVHAVRQVVTGKEGNVAIHGRFQPKNKPTCVVQSPFTDYPDCDELEIRTEGDKHPGITLYCQQLLDGIKMVFFLVDECPESIKLAFSPMLVAKKVVHDALTLEA